MSAAFAGPERRHHKLFVTRNTEYHVRDGRVVAVRKRGSGEWVRTHSSLGMEIKGKVEKDSLVPLPGEPQEGDRLYLASDHKDMVTSTVVSVERPPKEIVAIYPSLAA